MYIYGRNVCKKKILDNDRVNHAYLKENFNDREILELLKKNNIRYTFLQNKIMDKKVDGNHQGIILDVDDIKTYDLDYVINLKKNNPLIVILDHIEDPHNFGAIIRTSEALGVDAIIIPNDRCCNINSTVVKTSAGAIYDMPIVRVNNLSSALNKLKKSNYWVFGTDMKGSDYTKVNYDMPVCLIIGNEGKGISKTLEGVCDYMITIPMVGKINSLNASVSCGIILSRIVAQRGENGI